jgi:D-3-phosphoglycerate dehydrogenase
MTDSDFTDHRTEREIFERAGMRFEILQTRDTAEMIARAQDADALLVQYAPITPAIINGLPRLRVIGRYGVGFDTIDVDAATARGVYVCNCPDYCTEEVADHTLALLMAVTRQVFPLREQFDRGRWSIEDAKAIRRLRGRVLGIVGVGRIGSAVARRVAPLGFRLLGHDPYVPKKRLTALGLEPTPLADLLKQSDYVTLHTLLNAGTRHLINAERLALMKPGAVLINTSRGAVVDTNALVAALRSGRLSAAALDVLEQEPPPPGHPLRSMPNVILTPHVAFYSDASFPTLKRRVSEDVVRVLRGEPPENAVNREALARRASDQRASAGRPSSRAPAKRRATASRRAHQTPRSRASRAARSSRRARRR